MFDEECLGFLDQRKEVKKEWLQDPNQSNVDNLKNTRREAGIHFRNKNKEHLTAIETNSKMKYIRDLYRGNNDSKKGYQPRTNIVKNEKCDLVRDSHSILDRWRNHFSQLSNVMLGRLK